MSELSNLIMSSEYIRGLGFAIFGGFARIFASKKRLKAKVVLSGMLTAAFVGIVGIELIRYYKLDPKLIGLINVMLGYCHEEMVTVITAKFLAKVKKGNTDDV